MNKYTERNKKYNYKNIVVKPETYELLVKLKAHPRQSFDETIVYIITVLRESKEMKK